MEGRDALRRLRQLCGPSDPSRAAALRPNSLRALCGVSPLQNGFVRGKTSISNTANHRNVCISVLYGAEESAARWCSCDTCFYLRCKCLRCCYSECYLCSMHRRLGPRQSGFLMCCSEVRLIRNLCFESRGHLAFSL